MSWPWLYASRPFPPNQRPPGQDVLDLRSSGWLDNKVVRDSGALLPRPSKGPKDEVVVLKDSGGLHTEVHNIELHVLLNVALLSITSWSATKGGSLPQSRALIAHDSPQWLSNALTSPCFSACVIEGRYLGSH